MSLFTENKGKYVEILLLFLELFSPSFQKVGRRGGIQFAIGLDLSSSVFAECGSGSLGIRVTGLQVTKAYWALFRP